MTIINSVTGGGKSELGHLDWSNATFGKVRKPYDDEQVDGWNEVALESISGVSDQGESMLGPNTCYIRAGAVIGGYEDWRNNKYYGLVNGWVGEVSFPSDIGNMTSEGTSELYIPEGDNMPAVGTVWNKLFVSESLVDATEEVTGQSVMEMTYYATAAGTQRTDNKAYMRWVRGMRTADGENSAVYMYIGPFPGERWVFEGEAPEPVSWTFTRPQSFTNHKPKWIPKRFILGSETGGGWTKLLTQLRGSSSKAEYRCTVSYVTKWYYSLEGYSGWLARGETSADRAKRGWVNHRTQTFYLDGKEKTFNENGDFGFQTNYNYTLGTITKDTTASVWMLNLNVNDIPDTLSEEELAARGFPNAVITAWKCDVYIINMSIEGVFT